MCANNRCEWNQKRKFTKCVQQFLLGFMFASQVKFFLNYIYKDYIAWSNLGGIGGEKKKEKRFYRRVQWSAVESNGHHPKEETLWSKIKNSMLSEIQK